MIGDDYSPLDAMFPLVGLNTSNPPWMISQGESPSCKNVTFTNGFVETRAVVKSYPASSGGGGVLEYQNTIAANGFVYLMELTDTSLSVVAMSSSGGARNLVTGGTAYSISSDEPRQMCQFNDSGVEKVIACGGASGAGVSNISVLGSSTKAALSNLSELGTTLTGASICASFGSRLVLGNLNASVDAPSSIAWSEVGVASAWDPLEGANQVVVPDTEGALWKFLKLGSQLYIYTKNSIHSMTYMGDPQITFTIRKVLEGTALVSPNCMCNLWGRAHAWATRSNFMVWDGSSAPVSIGRKIQDSYISALDSAEQDDVFSFFDPINNRIWYGIPTTGANIDFYVYEFSSLGNLLNGFWTILNFGSGSIGTAGVVESKNNRAVVSLSANVGYRDDLLSANDDFTDIQIVWEWQSRDFVASRDLKSLTTRWSEVELEVKGSSASSAIKVYYSHDEGTSWTQINDVIGPNYTGATVIGSSWSRVRIPIDTTGEAIRIKVEGSEKRASIQWCRVWHQGGGRTEGTAGVA